MTTLTRHAGSMMYMIIVSHKLPLNDDSTDKARIKYMYIITVSHKLLLTADSTDTARMKHDVHNHSVT